MNITKGKGAIVDPGLCRCCGALKKCRLLNHEYEGLGRKEIYSDMFVDCFGLVLSHLDGEPEDRLICATCVTRLREASCFRQQVLECEEKLLKSKIHVHHDNKNGEVNEANLPQIKMEIEQMNEKTELSDHDNYVSDVETSHNKALEKSELPDSEKPLNSIKKSKIKIDIRSNPNKKKQTLKKAKRTNMRLIKIKINNKNDNAPVDKRDKKRANLLSDKSFLNVITIVENSYACPFNSFFNNYYCAYCRKKFVDCTKLREHSLTHDPTTYKGILTNVLRIRENRKCQIDLYRIDCRLCDENIDNIDTFKYHVSNVHGKTIYPEENDFLKFYLTPTNLKCTECNSTFSFFHTLKKHMAEHFGACICEVCGVHYFEERMLAAHMKSHQQTDTAFPCKQCGKSFKSKYNMKIHVARLHTKESAYLCSTCDATFFSDTLRQRHMIDVHGEDCSFKCDQCDKVCINKKTLRDHYRRIHLKILKHECNVCEKRFYLPCRLKEHMASHTGERNFRCEQCGKSYTRLRALKTHMQSHLSVKKYKCTMCSASYGQNVCLKNHIKRQHQHVESEESFQG